MAGRQTTAAAPVIAAAEVGTLDRQARWGVLRLLKALRVGSLTLIDSDGEHRFGAADETDGLHATVHIFDPIAYRKILFGGGIGAAEAYMDGHWGSPDLAEAMRLFVRNRALLKQLDTGPARLSQPLHRLYHKLHRNSMRGSRRNIAAHYDLSNAFFAEFLDATMTYSCPIFANEEATLEEAQVSKLDHICRKLELKPEDHLLEIGTGWGSFAVHAAKHYGCRVTTTTISRQQYDYAQERIRAAGLEDRIELLLEDYRNLHGKYDKIASIEMIEAVGCEYLDTYFDKCSGLLKSNGLMALQSSTILDQEYEQYIHRVDFIRRYIFPGGCLLSVTAISQAATRATDLRITHVEDITTHFSKTFRLWRERFLANADRILALGFDEHLMRMWEYYLAYCEAGFAERFTGNIQVVLAKPHYRA